MIVVNLIAMQLAVRAVRFGGFGMIDGGGGWFENCFGKWFEGVGRC